MPEPVKSVEIVLPDETATLAAAAALAPELRPGMVIFLQGDLGAGKTTFSRGLLRALGVTGRIKSPTYALVESYEVQSGAAPFAVHHFDVYRFSDPREWLDAGFDELLNPATLALVEWPDKAAGCLPDPDLTVGLRPQGEGRIMSVHAFSNAGVSCLTRIAP